MKKVFLLIFSVLAGLSLNAQDIKILYQGSTVVNGTFIVVNGDSTTFDISQNLWVQNNTTDTLDVRVTKIEMNVIPNTLNATCWDICPPSDTAGQFPTKTSPIIRMDPAAIEYSFAAHQYPEGISGCSHFRYIFFGEGTNYMDSVDVYFNHGQACSTPASIFALKGVEFDVFPNPAQNLINLRLDDNVTGGEIVISNIMGVTVGRYNIAELNGNKEISLEGFENGIYLLSVLTDERTITTLSFQVLK